MTTKEVVESIFFLISAFLFVIITHEFQEQYEILYYKDGVYTIKLK